MAIKPRNKLRTLQFGSAATFYAKYPAANFAIGKEFIVANPYSGVSSIVITCRPSGVTGANVWNAGTIESTSAFPGASAFPADWVMNWIQTS